MQQEAQPEKTPAQAARIESNTVIAKGVDTVTQTVDCVKAAVVIANMEERIGASNVELEEKRVAWCEACAMREGVCQTRAK